MHATMNLVIHLLLYSALITFEINLKLKKNKEINEEKRKKTFRKVTQIYSVKQMYLQERSCRNNFLIHENKIHV